MFKLEILKKNNSMYWTEIFRSEIEAQTWLTEEQTRDYWSKDFKVTITNITPAPMSKAESDLVATKVVAKEKSRRDFLDLDLSKIGTVKELVSVLKAVQEILRD